jgi:hypothetical protein
MVGAFVPMAHMSSQAHACSDKHQTHSTETVSYVQALLELSSREQLRLAQMLPDIAPTSQLSMIDSLAAGNANQGTQKLPWFMAASVKAIVERAAVHMQQSSDDSGTGAVLEASNVRASQATDGEGLWAGQLAIGSIRLHLPEASAGSVIKREPSQVELASPSSGDWGQQSNVHPMDRSVSMPIRGQFGDVARLASYSMSRRTSFLTAQLESAEEQVGSGIFLVVLVQQHSRLGCASRGLQYIVLYRWDPMADQERPTVVLYPAYHVC